MNDDQLKLFHPPNKMEFYSPQTFKEHLKMFFAQIFLWLQKHLGDSLEVSEGLEIDPYASSMLEKSNRLHQLLFPRFFEKIQVNKEAIPNIKNIAAEGQLVYITKYIGQLEYNYFTYLYTEEGLPLAKFANGLHDWFWMPWRFFKSTCIRRIEHFVYKGPLPHPVASGHIEELLKDGQSIFLRLKSTALHDDLYWENPNEDPLLPLIKVQKISERPIYLLPQQFLWGKRPEKVQKSWFDLIFGERENPNRFRKFLLFWRNYKSHAVVQIGEPLSLKTFLESHNSLSDEELVRILRNNLLGTIHTERKVTTGPALKPRRWVVEQILEDSSVQKTIYTLSTEKHKSLEDLKLLAHRYAKEIAADINYNYIELSAAMVDWICKTIFDNIIVDTEGIANIKKVASKHPIVLVPNHRSHVDYLIVSTIFYQHNIAVPHVAAGINLSFWPLGHIFRRCGAYFMRRTFSGNELYRAVFQAYLRLLLTEGYCQEFYIEGGRSRTGKLMPPKLGMLGMLSDAIEDGATKDCYFIPISITYDRVVEQTSYTNELEGGTKKKESFFDIFRLKKYLSKRYGRIYMNFGDPISYRETVNEVVAQPNVEQNKRIYTLQKLASGITSAINKNVIVTPLAVVATAILTHPRRGISIHDVFHKADLIMHYLKWKGVKFSPLLETEKDHALNEALSRFVGMRWINVYKDFEPVCYAIKDENRINLDYMKNTIIHFFVSLSVMATLIQKRLNRGIGAFKLEDLRTEFETCKTIFRHEFAFSSRLPVEGHMDKVMEYLLEQGILQAEATRDNFYEVNASAVPILEFYRSILTNYFEGYKAAIITCRKTPCEKMDEKTLQKTMLKYAQHLILLGQISRPEAISNAIFKNAIKLFKDLGFLVKETHEEAGKRQSTYTWSQSATSAENLQRQLEELC